MSEDNVETVRRAFEALYRKPEPDLAAMNALFDRDHEFISRTDALEGGSRRGMRGYRDWQEEVEETMEWDSTVESIGELTKIVRTEVHPSPDEALEAAGRQE